MGNRSSQINKVNFEDIQWIIKNNNSPYILINTLNKENQTCLIRNTISIGEEEKIINLCLAKKKNIKIIIYGKNTNDISIINKYRQLSDLGFPNTFIYLGGLFEWLCLQDIYGFIEFPTTSKEIDILKFKPLSKISHQGLIEDGQQ